jgi:hypothetical protein
MHNNFLEDLPLLKVTSLIFLKYVSGKVLEMNLPVILKVLYVNCCFMLSKCIVNKASNFSIPSRDVTNSNGNTSKTKVNESFDNGVFFDIEAKRTPLIVS